MLNLKYQSGDKAQYNDEDNRIFIIHTVYNKNHVSLGLYDYPEIEQDYQTHIKDISLVESV